jgi:hypothetical protein
MKTFFTIICTFFLGISFAQNEDVIEGLTATEFNGKVLLTWSIKQGNTCNGVQILRSLDSVNFTQIGSIEGICGSTAEKIDYEFTDLFPEKNAINYYRLSLGGIGFSWIVSTELIDIGGSNYMIRPNPISDSSELFFDNETNDLIHVNIYSQEGVLVKTISTNDEMVYLRKSEFKSGMYFFTLLSDNRDLQVSGKFLVD